MPVKNLPNDMGAEQSVLGAMFLSQYALQRASEALSKESFYFEPNGKIFQAMKDLAERKTPVDITTVTSELKQRNQLNEIGGVEYLTEIINLVPTAANVEYYVKIVEDDAILRRLIETATDVVTLGYNNEGSVNETLDEAERKILGVVKNRRSSEFRSIHEVLSKTQEDLEKLAQTKGEITGLATGWYDIDRLTSGLHENELIIIAARPSMGKTAFALNMATHMAQNTNKAIALFNLEMGAEQLAVRMLSSLGQLKEVDFVLAIF